MEPVERIALLHSDVQARVLDAILTDRGVPHVMRSYHCSAYDGLFQQTSGWGHVEAPARFRDEILAVLEGMGEAEEPLEDVPPEEAG
jgi:hypothetical protein